MAVCVALTGSAARAEPHHHHHGKTTKKKVAKKSTKHHAKVEDADDTNDRADDRSTEQPAEPAELAPAKMPDDDLVAMRDPPHLSGVAHHRRAHDDDAELVAFEDQRDRVIPLDELALDTPLVDEPVKVRKRVAPTAKPWHVAIGPYLWASSVDANVSLGPTSVGGGVSAVTLEQHAKYGAEILAEIGYGRFAFYSDLMYGVVAMDGSQSVGPFTVSLDGAASSVIAEGMTGYTLVGDSHSPFAIEARAGMRYQRTAVETMLGVSGTTIVPSPQITAGADALAGGHAVVRPLRWLSLSGTFDVSMFGASLRTWSASGDASVQLGSRLLVSLGYRTLVIDRTSIDLSLYGPRAAVQLTF